MSEKKQLIVDIRLALVSICAMHTGGVVACASMDVEMAILDTWAPPSNLMFMHYNAVKGLNWAKGYDAAVAIGCLNVTGRQIDDIVSAYVADDDDPSRCSIRSVSIVDPTIRSRNSQSERLSFNSATARA